MPGSQLLPKLDMDLGCSCNYGPNLSCLIFKLYRRINCLLYLVSEHCILVPCKHFLFSGEVGQVRVVTSSHQSCVLARKRTKTQPERPRGAAHDPSSAEGGTRCHNTGCMCSRRRGIRQALSRGKFFI